MRIGIMRRGLAFVAGAVIGVVVVTSALTHKATLTTDPTSLQMRSLPADLIAIP